MSALLGPHDLKNLALPLGWDGGELAKVAFADGTSYDAVIETLLAGLELANQGLLNDPILGGLASPTAEAMVEYREGTGHGMSERTEYQRAEARRAVTGGHMLPLKSYDRALGWTYDFLRKARPAQLEADIADALDDVRNNWERALLRRFFSPTENPIGAAGYDLPFAVGAGGMVAFTPPSYGGTSFSPDHSHFERRGADKQADALEAGAKHLWEHGIFGPYQGIIPFADVNTYTALGKFIKPDRGVEYVSTSANAPYAQAVTSDERYIGLYESAYGLVRLWVTPHLPTGYLGLYRGYENADPRNPLRVRYAPDLGAGAVLLRGEGFRHYPLENALLVHEFGVGVGNRLNGYACRFASTGDYSAPAIA